MNRILLLLALVLGLTSPSMAQKPMPPPAAEPPPNGIHKIVVPCDVCAHSPEGRGRLRLTPPDHGQYQGRVNSKEYFDVKCNCPICHGKGKRLAYRLSTPTFEGIPPCRICGWTGVKKCRKCDATGMVACANRGCRDGWFVRKVEIGSGKHNHHYKMVVDPCPACRGLGKVICPVCQGMGGTPCPSCHGLGKKVR